MAISTRKERQLREREELILDRAREMLAERGYLGLKLDELAEAVEYSKGTLYQHFSSKEDMILAICARDMEQRAALFRRAAAFEGRPRERMVAIGIAAAIMSQFHPDFFNIEQLVRTRSVWEKTSPERRAHLEELLPSTFAIGTGIVRDAREVGDLAETMSTDKEIVFALWSMGIGSFLLGTGAVWLKAVGLEHPLESMVRNRQVFLDGLGWRPLSTDWDYMATAKKVLDEIFPEEREVFTP